MGSNNGLSTRVVFHDRSEIVSQWSNKKLIGLLKQHHANLNAWIGTDAKQYDKTAKEMDVAVGVLMDRGYWIDGINGNELTIEEPTEETNDD